MSTSNSTSAPEHDLSDPERYAALVASKPNERPHDIIWRELERENRAMSDSIAREQTERASGLPSDIGRARDSSEGFETNERRHSGERDDFGYREMTDGRLARLAEMKASHAQFEALEIERQASRTMGRDGRG
jgi:hypothetical protein